jgi:plastocyanin
MKRDRLAVLIAAAILAVGLSALPVQAAGHKVKVSNFKFAPNPLSVPAGTKVVWTNAAVSTTHSVTAYGVGWTKNARLAAGAKAHFTFSTPGTYTYYCRFHASIVGGVCKRGFGNMCGTVTVT